MRLDALFPSPRPSPFGRGRPLGQPRLQLQFGEHREWPNCPPSLRGRGGGTRYSNLIDTAQRVFAASVRAGNGVAEELRVLGALSDPVVVVRAGSEFVLVVPAGALVLSAGFFPPCFGPANSFALFSR